MQERARCLHRAVREATQPFREQCYCVRHNSYAGYKTTSAHYKQIFVAHSAMKFYCLSTALLNYALSIVRGQHTAGEKNLELHFSAWLTSQYSTDLTKTSSRKEVWKGSDDVKINVIFISHFYFAFLCKIKCWCEKQCYDWFKITLFRRIIPCGEFIFSGFSYLEINEGEERNCFGLPVVGNSCSVFFGKHFHCARYMRNSSAVISLWINYSTVTGGPD